MNGYFVNISTEEYDEENNGPLIISDRYGSLLGTLKPSQKHDEDLLRLANNAFEEGFKQGKKRKAFELRLALGLEEM